MKVVLAYPGGLDTTVLLTWLQEKYNAEVICYCSNLGQEEELDGLEEKAIKHGAVKCIVDNVEEEFSSDYIFPMMQANAIYEGTYLLGTSIARPLIAKRTMDIVLEEGAAGPASRSNQNRAHRRRLRPGSVACASSPRSPMRFRYGTT